MLSDVSLTVSPGELVAVYGRPGSGKSTLLRIAAGREAPASGSVRFEGEEISPKGRRARVARRRIVWVEREGPLSRDLPARVYVALSLYRRLPPREAEREAVAALSRVGAADVADCRWSELTDTARSLVAVARALVGAPRLLIVDDVAAGLGIVDRERVVGLLRAAAEEDGLGVLMAVPDMPAMLHAHEVRLLSRGRLIAPSPPRRGTVVDIAAHKRGVGS